MMRRTEYLYVNEPFAVRVPLATEGAGSTITAKLCAQRDGTPAAIGTLTRTASTLTGDEYVCTFASADLTTQLAGLLDALVYLHVTSSAHGWYEVYPYRVTVTDPDLLPPLYT